jgi:3',5'-cyclic AMP phosphodiesterase CpdA
VRFIVFGDSGTGDAYQRAVAQQMQTVPYDFALHTGDIAYGSGMPNELEEHFFDVYRKLTRSFAVFPITGNHDFKTAGAKPFFDAFDLPKNAPTGLQERYYSFDWGNVHFVALDTELMNAQQAAWLDADLSANQREWVVAFGHRPPFSSGEHGSSNTFRKVFSRVLEKHRVPLVLSGHEHNYERTRPINGVTYIVTGGGGRETRPVGHSTFTAYAEDVLHFVYIEVRGPELVLHAIDGVGRQFDSVKLSLRNSAL